MCIFKRSHMVKLFWGALISNIALGGALVLCITNKAQGNPIFNSDPAKGFIATESSQAQITSVFQLQDVVPTSWAYEALQSLVERYGCLTGYLDHSFKGDKSLSRWEFAAGLNACLNSLERLIQQGNVSRDDIEKLKKLTQDFQIELTSLGNTVIDLENRQTYLENHNFSATTKLTGEAVFSLAGATTSSNQIVLQNRVRLELDTSFGGEDILVTRLAAGNFNPFFSGTVAGGISPTTTQANSIGGITNNSVSVDLLGYLSEFKIGNIKAETYLTAQGGSLDDFVPLLDPYFTDTGDGGRGAISSFAQEAPIIRIGGGTVAGINFYLGSSILTLGYSSGANSSDNGANIASPNSGLFNGSTAFQSQITEKIGSSIKVAFTYINSYQDAGVPIFSEGGSGLIGGALVGTQLANGYSGDNTGNPNGEPNLDSRKISNSFGLELSWKISNELSFNSFGSYTKVGFLGTGVDGAQSGEGEVWSFGVRLAYLDLGKQGSVLGFDAGVQPYFGNISVQGINGNYSIAMPVQLELFYKYPLTNNILITPGIIWLSHTTQAIGDGSQLIGVIRTTVGF